jgi:FAD synthetase
VLCISAGASAADLVEESTADDWRSPLGTLQRGNSASTHGRSAAVVALGKFDALHRGHRLLVEQAASMGDVPWLISFSGMAQELGEAAGKLSREVHMTCGVQLKGFSKYQARCRSSWFDEYEHCRQGGRCDCRLWRRQSELPSCAAGRRTAAARRRACGACPLARCGS